MKRTNTDQQATSAIEHRDDRKLTAEQMAYIKKFIEEVGGIENARAAIGALEKLQQAA